MLDVAHDDMIVGEDCSSASPCWVLAGSHPLPTIAGGGQTLSSSNSIKLLGHYSCPYGHKRISGRAGQLLDESVLQVLWAVDPASFFLAYPRADEQLLVAIPATAIAVPFFIPGDTIPEEVSGSLNAK